MEKLHATVSFRRDLMEAYRYKANNDGDTTMAYHAYADVYIYIYIHIIHTYNQQCT